MSKAHEEKHQAIIISISADIGFALAEHWHKLGMHIAGTYRHESALINHLKNKGVHCLPCDIEKSDDVKSMLASLREAMPVWDYLVFATGSLEPVGPFMDTDFDAWEKSVAVNFTRQMQILHGLLPARRGNSRQPVVLFFAGGGTNSAVTNYAAYTISKIALIKMCELLDAELPDTNFVIVGPGWVKTKIHEATFKAADKAGSNYQKSLKLMQNQEGTPMEKILDCCDWLIKANRASVSGRNFSVVYDQFGSAALEEKLKEDPNMYKLRRHGNDWKA